MKRFKNILVHVDVRHESSPALQRAVDLAILNQGRLRVVSVLLELPLDLRRLAAAMPLEELERIAAEELRGRLEQMVTPFREKAPFLELEVLSGKPFIEIIRAVQRSQHDLVMVTEEGTGKFGHMVFGSLNLHLLRKCPCPVWVLKGPGQPTFTRILAAVDPDAADVVRDGVSRKVMELAVSLTLLEKGELHVVHAWEFHENQTGRGWQARVPEAQLRDWLEQTRAAHEQRFQALLSRFDLGSINHRVHLVRGEAGDAIPRLAAENQIDLIVMGTVARTGIDGYLMGNTAETVLQQVNCGVLTTKPDGFVSPVRLVE
jgi:nucleotide-binding universal stress UspA family protein